MTDPCGDGCDCACILAAIDVWEAAIPVRQAAADAATAAVNEATMNYYYYLYKSYMCACGGMMAAASDGSKAPLTVEQFAAIKDGVAALRNPPKQADKGGPRK